MNQLDLPTAVFDDKHKGDKGATRYRPPSRGKRGDEDVSSYGIRIGTRNLAPETPPELISLSCTFHQNINLFGPGCRGRTQGYSCDAARNFPSTIINLDHGRKWRFYARPPQHLHQFRSWQVTAHGAVDNCGATMATTPTMAINSEPAGSPKAAFDDRRKGICRNHNVHTFGCPQKWRF